MTTELQGRRILITGATGQVAFPIARSLAADNEVLAVGRFGKAEDRERVAATGAVPVVADLCADDLSAVPADVDVVLHFAVARSGENDFDGDLTMNAEGAGRLLAHCRSARRGKAGSRATARTTRSHARSPSCARSRRSARRS